MGRALRIGQSLVAAGLVWSGAVFSVPPEADFGQPPAEATLAARAAVTAPDLARDRTVTASLLRGSMAPGGFAPARRTLPDFSVYRDVLKKKEEFFSYLAPLVEHENRRVAAVRRRLGYIHDMMRWRRPLEPHDTLWLEKVAAAYRLEHRDWLASSFWDELLARVDTLPLELVLVQAANESAWGTSRFAREGNNLFGQWCFRAGCGMVPSQRPEGATYEVARFASVGESIGSYMHNLNTGRPYRLLRDIRQRMRGLGDEPDPLELAQGLSDYSERGADYVAELQVMIRQNRGVIATVTELEPAH